MKIKMRYLAVLAAGSLLVSNIAASSEMQALAGAGALSCGKFIADTEDSEIKRNLYFFWGQGFLSGLNFKHFLNAQFATNLSEPKALELWIENYCKDNPLDIYAKAIMQLWHELRRRQGLHEDTIIIPMD